MSFKDRFPALASRDFLIFWVGQFISLIGTWMQNTTLPYLAYRISGRPMDLGLIGFAATLPTLLLALPGGVIVERLDKRKTVIVLQTIMMLQAFTLAFLALSGLIQIWHIFVLAFLLGTANAVEITARQAMLIELVGKAALPNAIALQSTIFNTARVLGPSLSAAVMILIQNNGEGWAFFINGVSFLFVIMGMLFVRTPYKVTNSRAENGKGHLLKEFKEGQRYIFGNTLVLAIILAATMIGFFGFPFGQQIPAIARDVLAGIADSETAVKARTSALYLFQGIGALIASLYLSINSNVKRKGWLLALGQFVFVCTLGGISFVRQLPIALGLILILGWSMVTQLAMMNTLIQLEVPDMLRGRVFSTYLWALQGVAPFGSLFIGWLAQTRGVPRAALVCGTICLVGLSAMHAAFPAMRTKTA